MAGADAVVDLQDERVPRLRSTAHRKSGTAVRAVDDAGRRQLRSRWFAAEAARLCGWMLWAVGVSFAGSLAAAALASVPDLIGLGHPLRVGETVTDRLMLIAGVAAAVHSVPLVMVLAARWLLWPQLLRPAALSILALGGRPLAGLAGWLACAVVTGRWVGGLGLALLLLDPVNLGILAFAWFVVRRVWRITGEFQRLAPDAGTRPAAARRAVGGSAAAATAAAYALGLAGFVAWSQYFAVRDFALPGNAAWKARQAEGWFNAGRGKLEAHPAEARAEFRRALTAWQELTASEPSRPEFRHNLAATLQNLGVLAARANDADGAEALFGGAVAEYEKLEVAFPSYQAHRADLARVRDVLKQLRSAKAVKGELQELLEALRLEKAGKFRELAELYSRALERAERQRVGNPDPAAAPLVAARQNRLAWFLVVCPDVMVRDPKRAVELALRATEATPDDGNVWNTLGGAYCRAGDWDACARALDRSMRLRQGGDGFDWVFLAIACHRRGQPAEAASGWRKWSVRSPTTRPRASNGPGTARRPRRCGARPRP
jgi:tetratricopeptide (TPR) repeat protein